MSSSTWTRVRSTLLVLVLVLSLTLVPQLVRSTPAAAAPAAQMVSICGTVSSYTAATSSGNGTITIGTTRYTILAGTTFTGPAAGLVANAAILCFQLTLNSSGQITAGVVTGPTFTSGTMQICGVVTAFSAATAGAPGSITIAGQTFTMVTGSVGTGVAIAIGTSHCIIFTLNAAGQVVAFRVARNLPGVSIVCGIFIAFFPAVGVAQAFIVVNGVAFPVNTAVFVPVVLVKSRFACFLLSPSGFVIGFLSAIPTLAAPVEAADGAHRVGRILAR